MNILNCVSSSLIYIYISNEIIPTIQTKPWYSVNSIWYPPLPICQGSHLISVRFLNRRYQKCHRIQQRRTPRPSWHSIHVIVQSYKLKRSKESFWGHWTSQKWSWGFIIVVKFIIWCINWSMLWKECLESKRLCHLT